MEKLGAKYPTTFDELYDLCVQVRDADLDGNGVNDTYSCISSQRNLGILIDRTLFFVFGVVITSSPWSRW